MHKAATDFTAQYSAVCYHQKHLDLRWTEAAPKRIYQVVKRADGFNNFAWLHASNRVSTLTNYKFLVS